MSAGARSVLRACVLASSLAMAISPIGAQDATPDRAASEPLVGALDSSRPTDKSSTSRASPAPHGPGRRKDGRTEGQAILARGIWEVTVAPGPYGVRLSFNASRYHRVLVQFSHKPPPWDDREGHWGYPAGWDSPWYAEIEHQLDSDRYTAIPFSKLKAGARYHYLISVVGADNVQRESPRSRLSRTSPRLRRRPLSGPRDAAGRHM